MARVSRGMVKVNVRIRVRVRMVVPKLIRRMDMGCPYCIQPYIA